MAKTGIGLIEILALVAILLPLIPVFIIFIFRAYKHEALSLLMVFCLLSFIQNLILYIPGFIPINSLFIRATFQLSHFVILLLLLRMIVKGRWLREGLKVLLVSFFSVVITVYGLRGVGPYFRTIEMLQAFFLIGITLVALFQLIRKQDLFIFNSPMFWIVAGTFFYYSMFLLTQSLPEYNPVIAGIPYQQKRVLLLIIILIQYLFYTIAAAVSRDKIIEKQIY